MWGKIKKKIFNNGSAILITIVLLLVILLNFMSQTDKFLQKSSGRIKNTGHLKEILAEDVYTQELTSEKDGLDSIKLLLATFNRVNHSTFFVEISENNELIQKWSVDCKKLQDNSYYTFKLNQRIPDSCGKKYILRITSDAKPKNGICIYTNDEKDKKGLSLNGTDLDKTLCYQLSFVYPFSSLWNEKVRVFHLGTVLLLSLLALAMTHFIRKWKIENAFLAVWCVLCIIHLLSNTPFNVPDESAHYGRSYEVSCGHAVSVLNKAGTAGGREMPLPGNVNLFKANWQSFHKNKGMNLSDKPGFYVFTNIALYSPISYIPQASGMFIARHLTNNVAAITYAGRIANLAAITFFMYLALKLIPAGQLAMALIFLMPMNIHEAVSLAPDGMVVALSAFMIAFVLYVRYRQKNVLSKKQIVLLYALGIAISQYKIVYLPFCLLYFLIPSEKFGGGTKKWIHAALMAIIIVVGSAVWLQAAEKFLLHRGTDSVGQVDYIIHHPIEYILVMWRTYMQRGWDLLCGLVGRKLAWLNVAVSDFIIALYMAMLLFVYYPKSPQLERERMAQKGIFFAVCFSTFILLSTALYVQWTPVANNVINGLQGRYFISLMLPLYFALNQAEPQENEEFLSIGKSGIAVCVNACACFALLFNRLV